MNARSLRILFVGAGLALAPLALVPIQPAEATTLAEMSVEQLVDASDYVVRGEVTEVWTDVDDKGRIWTRARVTVARVFKGPDQPGELIVDSLGGEYAGQELLVEARAEFSVLEDALMFLSQQSDGRLVPVGKFLGKYTIRRAPGDARFYARTWHPQAGLPFDARFLPHPRPEERTYLDDLERRIEDRLDAGWDGKPIPGLSAEKLAQINTPERRQR